MARIVLGRSSEEASMLTLPMATIPVVLISERDEREGGVAPGSISIKKGRKIIPL